MDSMVINTPTANHEKYHSLGVRPNDTFRLNAASDQSKIAANITFAERSVSDRNRIKARYINAEPEIVLTNRAVEFLKTEAKNLSKGTIKMKIRPLTRPHKMKLQDAPCQNPMVKNKIIT